MANIIHHSATPTPPPVMEGGGEMEYGGGFGDNMETDDDLMMLGGTTTAEECQKKENEILMSIANDDAVPCCPTGATTEECEEDRRLLEAFLNGTDIDLIENDDAAYGGDGTIDDSVDVNVNKFDHQPPHNSVTSATGGEGGGQLQNIRQVSDGTYNTSATAATAATAVSVTPSPTMLPPPPTPPPSTTTEMKLTGRPPIQLYLSCNPDHLSEYQCLIRKNIEFFEATQVDTQSKIKGRNKPIVLGQVGIRCIFCKHVFNPEQRGRGSMYYPHKLTGVYQAAQILCQGHFLQPGICGHIPQDVQNELLRLKQLKSNISTKNQAGKDYWAGTSKALGVYEDEYGLRFQSRLGLYQPHNHH